MNNNFMSEWEYDIMSFRLQTERRKKRMQYEDFEKHLIALHKERAQLYKQQHALGWVELKPPIMRGWKRFFVLRDDVARSKHASFFEGILQKINKVEYSSRKDFKVKKRKQGKKIYVVRDQQLLQPDEWHFKKLKFSEREMPFFEVRHVRQKGAKELTKKYVFVEPWRFILRVRPNMITRTRARDEVIQKRIHEIDAFLETNALEGKMYRLLNGSYKWRHYEAKGSERNPFKNKSLTVVFETVKEERWIEY